MISDAFGSNRIPFRKVPFVELRSVIKNRFPSLDILAWRRLTLWSFNTRSTAPAIFPTVIGSFCNGIWYLLLLYPFIPASAIYISPPLRPSVLLPFIPGHLLCAPIPAYILYRSFPALTFLIPVRFSSIASGEISTQSQVRPSISPSRREHEKDRLIASFNLSSSQTLSAYINVSAVQMSLFWDLCFGTVAWVQGFFSINSHFTACSKQFLSFLVLVFFLISYLKSR